MLILPFPIQHIKFHWVTGQSGILVELFGHENWCNVRGDLLYRGRYFIFGMSLGVFVLTGVCVCFYACVGCEKTQQEKRFPLGVCVICPHSRPFFSCLVRECTGWSWDIVGWGWKCWLPRVISFHPVLSLDTAEKKHWYTVHKCVNNHSKSITFPMTSPSVLSYTGARLQKGRRGEGIAIWRLTTRVREREQEREGGRERAGTMSTAQLPAQSAEIHSSARKLTESRQNAAASAVKRQTQQRHGIWQQNTNSKRQNHGLQDRICRNSLKFTHNPAFLKGALCNTTSEVTAGQFISQGSPSEVGK